MVALQARGAVRRELVWSRTTTTVINTAGKLVVKDGTCVGSEVVDVVGLS